MRKKQKFLSNFLNLYLSKLMIISTCLFLSCNPGKTNQSQTKSILDNQSHYFNNIQTDPTTDQSIENADLSLQLPDENQQPLDDPQIIAQAYGKSFYFGKFRCKKSYTWGTVIKRAVKHGWGQDILGINCVNSNNQQAYGAPGEVPGATRFNGGSTTVVVVGSDCSRSGNDKKYYAVQPDLNSQMCFVLEGDLGKL
jgi:hypothetical protein